MAKGKGKINETGANLGFETKLWQAADALRNNMDFVWHIGHHGIRSNVSGAPITRRPGVN